MTLTKSNDTLRHALVGEPACTMILSYHLKRPDSPDPDLELSLNAFDIVQVDTFPPTAAGWLPPE